MLSREELAKMRQPEDLEIDISRLTDMRDISIDMDLPLYQRLESYQRQLKNPYCFLSGDTVVRVKFTGSGKSIDEALANCFSDQKSC